MRANSSTTQAKEHRTKCANPRNHTTDGQMFPCKAGFWTFFHMDGLDSKRQVFSFPDDANSIKRLYSGDASVVKIVINLTSSAALNIKYQQSLSQLVSSRSNNHWRADIAPSTMHSLLKHLGEKSSQLENFCCQRGHCYIRMRAAKQNTMSQWACRSLPQIWGCAISSTDIILGLDPTEDWWIKTKTWQPTGSTLFFRMHFCRSCKTHNRYWPCCVTQGLNSLREPCSVKSHHVTMHLFCGQLKSRKTGTIRVGEQTFHLRMRKETECSREGTRTILLIILSSIFCFFASACFRARL